MQITLRTLLESAHSVAELAGTVKIPVKPSYSLGRTLDSVASEQSRFHKKREELARSLAELGDDGKPLIETKKDQFGRDNQSYKVSPENEEKLKAQLDELLDEKIEIAGRQIALDELGNIEVRAEIFKNLNWLVVQVLGTESSPVIANSPIVERA